MRDPHRIDDRRSRVIPHHLRRRRDRVRGDKRDVEYFERRVALLRLIHDHGEPADPKVAEVRRLDVDEKIALRDRLSYLDRLEPNRHAERPRLTVEDDRVETLTAKSLELILVIENLPRRETLRDPLLVLSLHREDGRRELEFLTDRKRRWNREEDRTLTGERNEDRLNIENEIDRPVDYRRPFAVDLNRKHEPTLRRDRLREKREPAAEREPRVDVVDDRVERARRRHE